MSMPMSATRQALQIALMLGASAAIAQTVPADTGSQVPQELAQQALNRHNRARQEVGVPPLQWSPKLAAFAQQWASRLASQGCRMEHRPDRGRWGTSYGENIFWGSDKRFTALDGTESWYSEIRDFRPGTTTGSEGSAVVGHYTQMVWKTTTHVGIGQAVCRNGAVMIVANYDPAGNYVGEAPY